MEIANEAASRGVAGLEKVPPITPAGWLLLLVLASVQFTHIVDFTIIMPLGPRYETDLHITTQQFGFLVSAYAFTACVSGFLASLVIDRFDRKRAMLFLYAGFTVGTLLCGVAFDLWTLLMARCVAGAFGGVLGALSLAVIGDVFHEKQRGLATGIVLSSFSMATVLGLPAGLWIAELFNSSGAPFLFLGALSAAMLVLAGLVLPPLRSHLTPGKAHFRLPLEQLLFMPAHLRAYMLISCLTLGTFMVVPFISKYMVANAGFQKADLPLIYLAGGAATLVTMSIFGRLSDRFGKLVVSRILIVLAMVPIILITNFEYLLSLIDANRSFSLTVGGMTMFTTVRILATLAVTTLFMIVTSGRMVPSMALITSSAAPAYRGSFMSIISSVQQMSMGLGSVLGGLLLTQTSEGGPIAGYPLDGWLGCISSVIAVVLVGKLRPASPVQPHPSLLEEVAEAMAPEAGVPAGLGEEGIVAISEGVQ